MCKKNNIKQHVIKDVVYFLRDELASVELIIIFGSYISEHFDPQHSDIDIAFLNADILSDVQRWNIQEKLASRLNRDIDLVDLQTCNDVLKLEIVHHGQIIYQQASLKTEQFLDNAYINYIQLNEDRAEILEHYS